MSQTRSASAHTLGAALERDRLAHRVSRFTLAIAMLRQLAGGHRGEPGGAPRHIRHTIADFEAQLAAMTARLQDLAHDRGPTETPERERIR